MGKILEAFASDNLRVNAVGGERSPKQQEFFEKSCRLQEEMEGMLDEEAKALLNRLIDNIYDENGCQVQDAFIRGYRLGVLMTMEVFSNTP